jgi:adenylyltransferase/sulfurtransferase
MLSDEQIERYSRQIILPQVGGKGQEKLLRSHVLVNSDSTLHVTTLHYLAAAGVGTIGIVASAPSQLLTALAPSPLVEPFHVLTRLNPDCSIILHTEEDLRSPRRLVQDYDLVLSDSDLLHDVCWEIKRPFLYASVSTDEAWMMHCRGYEVHAPCLHCASPSLPSQWRLTPVAEIAALFLGAHLATEAIKTLLNLPGPLLGALLRFQISTLHCTEEIVKKSSTCTTCGTSLPEIL